MRTSHGFAPERFVLLFGMLLALLNVLAEGFAQSAPPTDLSSVRVTSQLRPELDVRPGETRMEQVTLENRGSEAVLVNVAKADFLLDLDGGVAYEAAGSLPVSNAEWVEVASQAEIPAMSTFSLPIAVHVPADVDPGSYWSLILVQPIDAGTVEETTDEGVRATVTMSIRYGINLITHVGNRQDVEVVFQDPSLSHNGEDESSSVLSVVLGNPTRFMVSGDVWLELYDQQGNLVEQVDGDRIRIYPDAARRHTFDLALLSEGAYQAVIIADAGDDNVFGVRYDLDVSPE